MTEINRNKFFYSSKYLTSRKIYKIVFGVVYPDGIRVAHTLWRKKDLSSDEIGIVKDSSMGKKTAREWMDALVEQD